MSFTNYLEDENDKPYFTKNSLAYYYDKMEGFAKAVEGSAKALNLTKEEIEQRITFYIEQNKNELDQRLEDWDGKLETFDSSVETLLAEWVDDGTLTHVIDSTLIDQKIAPVAALLAENEGAVEGKVTGKPLKKGVLSFTFDNSFKETYTKVFPEFKSRGINFAVSPVASGFANTQASATYYNYSNLKEMVNNGTEVISHGMDGLVLGSTDYSVNQAEYEINEAKKYWNKLGFKVNGYCGTNSSVNALYKPSLLSGYDYAFTKYWSERPVNTATVNANTDIYEMGRHSLFTTYSKGGVDAVKAEIDYVESSKTWLNYYNHQIDTGVSDSVPLSDLLLILDYALTKDIEILTPTEAVNRLNTKLVAGENINKIRSEMSDSISLTKDNIALNPRFSGGTTKPTSWGEKGNIVSGLTKSLIALNGYNAIKYAFDATNNVGNYVGVSQVLPLNPLNKADILTFSIEVDSDSSGCDLYVSMSLQNGSSTVNSYNERVQLVSGKKGYEFSLLVPKSGYTQLSYLVYFYPTAATAMNVIHAKPKIEYSGKRTPWNAPIEYTEPVPVDTGISFKTMNDNNPTPTVTGDKYILLGNSTATIVTDLVTTDYSQEITLVFTNANTTITGGGLIRLRDGQNFVSSNGAVLTLIRTKALSSAWYEKSRTVRTI